MFPSVKLFLVQISSAYQLTAIGLEQACQHPRWNLEGQGSPLSVYMRYDRALDICIYIISHKPQDNSVMALKELLDLGLRDVRKPSFMKNPLDIHVMLYVLAFESAKFHVHRYRRFMWSQVSGLSSSRSVLSLVA
jgi:hypothetical protein